MNKINFFFLVFIFYFSKLFADDQLEFLKWKNDFKNLALANDISEITFDTVMSEVKFFFNFSRSNDSDSFIFICERS